MSGMGSKQLRRVHALWVLTLVLQPGWQHPQLKLHGSNRMSSRHCYILRMGVLTLSAGTGTSTIIIA